MEPGRRFAWRPADARRGLFLHGHRVVPAAEIARAQRERPDSAVSRFANAPPCRFPKRNCSWTNTSSQPSRWLRTPSWVSSSARATRRTTTTTWIPESTSESRAGIFPAPSRTGTLPEPGEPAARAAARLGKHAPGAPARATRFARGRWSSETRFGYNYNWLSRTDPFYNVLDPVNPGPSDLEAKNRRQIPSISYPGLLQLGSEQHTRGQQPSYSFEQQVTLVANRHSFKFGGIYATPQRGAVQRHGSGFLVSDRSRR